MTGAAPMVPLRLRLPFASVAEFTQRYGHNVRRNGIFVATGAAKATGTLIAFDIILAGGERLLLGEGRVEARPEDLADDRPGMWVRFLKLDPASKRLLDSLQARTHKAPDQEPATQPRLGATVALGLDASTSSSPRWAVYGDSGLSVLNERPALPLPRPAVVAVSASSTAADRATLLANLKERGVDVERVVSAPALLAVAHGAGKALARQRMLVFHADGGALDAALVEVTGDDVDVISVGGFVAPSGTLAGFPEGVARTGLEALEAARLLPTQLDGWILGGSAEATLAVEPHLRALVGRASDDVGDRETAVARGAALHAHALFLRGQGKHGGRIAEVLTLPLTAATQTGGLKTLLERNTRLPFKKSVALSLTRGTSAYAALFQGASMATAGPGFVAAVTWTVEHAGDWDLILALSEQGLLDIGVRGPQESRPLGLTVDSSQVDPERFLQSPFTESEPTPSAPRMLDGLKRLFQR